MKNLLILLWISLFVVSTVLAQTTYNKGDAYIGEDANNPKWVWNFDASRTYVSSAKTFAIESNFLLDEKSDNPPGVGGCIGLPDDYVKLCLEGLTSADYYTYTFEIEVDSDLSESDPNWFEGTSVPTVYIHTNRANGLKTWAGHTTNKLWLYWHPSDSRPALYYEDSNGKTQKEGNINPPPLTNSVFATINHDSEKPIKMTVEGGGNNDYVITIKSEILQSTPISSKLDDELLLRFGVLNNGFYSLGSQKNAAEQNELKWRANDGSNNPLTLSIGTKDEDHRTIYGMIIKNPQAHGGNDGVVLEIPSQQVKAKISVKGLFNSASPISYHLGTPITLPLAGYQKNVNAEFKGGLLQALETFRLGKGTLNVRAATSLTSNEDTYGTNVFLETDKNAITYDYMITDQIDLKQVSSSTPLKIKFLGKDLKIVSVPVDHQIVVEGSVEVSCTDSDGGKNYYAKGNVIVTKNGVTIPGKDATDYCTGVGNELMEFICQDNDGLGITYNCPNGCQDGACKQQTSTCTDSDGGKNYYIKGTTTGADSQGNLVTEEDNCGFTVSDTSTIDYDYVNEFYCSGSVVYGTQYDCPNGCQNGACVSECGDDVCGEGEDVSCPEDCDEITCNYNGVCDLEEDENCIDCIKVEDCNKNQVCELSRGENSNNCPEDCYCGDGICDSEEDYKDCPNDCRYCMPEWECHLEPATCPEEGIQNKVCIDTKCGSEDKREEALKCVPGACSGCLSEGICYPVTTRMLLDETPSYCDVTKSFAKQKELGAQCQNNYECKSNECSDGECISIKKELEETRSLLERILDWLKKIF